MVFAALTHFVKKYHQKISIPPPDVPQEYNRWFVLGNYIDIFAVVNNLNICIIAWYLHMWMVVVCSILVCLVYANCFREKLVGKYRFKVHVPMGYTVVVIASTVDTVFTGWQCGFQYYMMVLLVSLPCIPLYNWKERLFISTGLFGIFIITFIATSLIHPVYIVPRFWEYVLSLNSMFCFFLLSFIYIPYIDNRAHKMLLKKFSNALAKNAELERLSRLKDDFLANTSHELRTPLHGISGIAESLSGDPVVKASPFLSKNLRYIIDSALRLTNLVNDILDFSKMRHNELLINPKPIDAVQLIESILPNFSAQAIKKGISIMTDFPVSLPKVMVDDDRFIQIIFNLVGNAIKFTDYGSITISAQSKDANVMISVKDSGIGIAEKDLSTIFNAFEQVSINQKEYRGGTGLGLSITKKLVELHGGAISVASVLGCGSTFTVALPVADMKEQCSDIMSSPVINHAFQVEPDISDSEIEKREQISTVSAVENGEKRIVLAIDDEIINLQILRNHLEPLGLKVVIAESGINLDQLISLHNPSLILLDIMMPGINGYDCCRAIRSKFTIAEMPVIFISAKNRISDLRLGFEAGGNDYVLKPFLKEELIARVNGQIRLCEAVDVIRENAKLKSELADRLIEEAHLKHMQERLTRLLHTVDDAILVADDDGRIVFANQLLIDCLGLKSGEAVTGKDASSLIHSDARQSNLLTAKLSKMKYTPVLFARSDGKPFEFSVKRATLTIGEGQLSVFTMRPPVPIQDSARVSEWVIGELEKNQQRIFELETISAEFVSANRRIMEQLSFHEHPRVDPFAIGNRIMVATVALWKEAYGT